MLSPAQLVFWPTGERRDEHAAYAVRLHGPLDADRLRLALDALVDRHEPLRTTYTTNGTEPHTAVLPAVPMPFAVVDLPASPDPAGALDRLLATHIHRPFDVAGAPPIRSVLVRLAEDDHVLLVTAHRLAVDEPSWDVAAAELSALYRNGTELPPPTSFGEVMAAQHNVLATDRDRHEKYWRDQLDAVPVLDLPTDRPRPAHPTGRLGSVSFTVTAAGMAAVADAHAVPIFTPVFAAFATLLTRYSRQSDVVIGAVPPTSEPVLGPCALPVPLRVNLDGDPSFNDAVDRVAGTVADAHRDIPVELLLDDPVYQAGLTVTDRSLALGGVRAEELHVADRSTLDVSLELSHVDHRLVGELRYSTDLFDHHTVEQMATHLRNLVSAAGDAPTTRLSELAMLDPAEREQLTTGWNHTEASVPEPFCVPDMFERRVVESPGACAVIAPDETLTYAQLDTRANRLAHRLRELGVTTEVAVCVMTGRSAGALVAFLGVLKAGGTYVPTDPTYPAERIAYVVRHAHPAVVVTQRDLADRLPADTPTLLLDDELPDAPAPSRPSDPDALAYVIYTSGSTGQPKGVEVAHRGVANLAAAQCRMFELTPHDRVALFASFGFDASVWEISMALLNGATAYVVDTADRTPAQLAAEMRDNGVTVATVPPAFLAALSGDELPGVRLLVAAGEQCPAALVRAWGTGRTFVNAYGPTETTVCATAEICDPASGYAPPIGRPLQNIRVHVADESMGPVPLGASGELHIAGVALARGYRGSPRMTAAAFVPDPYGPPGTRRYRSGDLARHRQDGRVHYVGRVDNQLKIRGYRVEPGEVEAALVRYPQVRDAVVVPTDAMDGLVGYLVLAPGARSSSGLRRELRLFLEGIVPGYMIPQSFVTVDAFPLTTNGKIDRAALPEPGADQADEDTAAPYEGIEEEIAGIWAKHLGLDTVGREDHFLEIGGHSLVAAQVLADVQESFTVQLAIRALFENPVLSEFAAVVASAPSA
jgi:amino acid adenylation domain-containing protein